MKKAMVYADGELVDTIFVENDYTPENYREDCIMNGVEFSPILEDSEIEFKEEHITYVLVDLKGADMFTEEFEDKESALNKAESEWDHLSDHDKSKRDAFYVIEVTDGTLDGDVIKRWR